MSVTNICNLALSQVPAGSITSIDEASIPARACKLWYPQVLSELMTKAQWRFAMTRGTLAAIDSDRLGEWLYAYSLPANMAFPIDLLDAGGFGPNSFLFTGSTLYANTPEAMLDYVTGADVTANADGMFRAAFIATLAARVCLPITKNAKQTLALSNAAEVATERAVAFNTNLNPVGYMDHIPDSVKARLGMVYDTQLRFSGPEATYPDFDPVGAFEDELG